MSFTSRVLAVNALLIIVAVAVIVGMGPKNFVIPNVAIGSILLCFSSLALWMLCKRAFAPLATIVSALETAARGDLSARIPQQGSGEFSRLSIAFNSMMNDMNGTMRRFFSVAELVHDSVGLVSSTTVSIAVAGEDVAMQAHTIATASEEMSATSADIARNCLFAAENASTNHSKEVSLKIMEDTPPGLHLT